MRASMRALLLLLGASALAACDTVEFESPPGELTPCDEALVGDWRLDDLREEPGADGRQYLRVTAGCDRWYTVSAEAADGGGEKIDVDDLEEDMVLGFARTEGQAWIATRDAPKPSERAPQDKPDGFTLVAWTANDDGSLTLRLIDLRKAARLVVDGVVPGWVEKRDRRGEGAVSSFWVFVFGSPPEVRAMLGQHDLLDAPWMRLLPASTAESAEVDAWLRDAGAGKQGFEAGDG